MTRLDPGTTYSFQLRSVNPAGKSPSTLNNLTTKNIAVPPPAGPRNFTAVNGDGPRQVRLSWEDPNPADPTIIRWEYRRSEQDSTQSAGWAAWTTWTTASGGGAAREATVSALDLLSKYRFQLRAVGVSDGRLSGPAFVSTRGVKTSVGHIDTLTSGSPVTYTVIRGARPADEVVIEIKTSTAAIKARPWDGARCQDTAPHLHTHQLGHIPDDQDHHHCIRRSRRQEHPHRLQPRRRLRRHHYGGDRRGRARRSDRSPSHSYRSWRSHRSYRAAPCVSARHDTVHRRLDRSPRKARHHVYLPLGHHPGCDTRPVRSGQAGHRRPDGCLPGPHLAQAR